jgi:hypothetical protein
LTVTPPSLAGTGMPDRGSDVPGEENDFSSDIIALQLGTPPYSVPASGSGHNCQSMQTLTQVAENARYALLDVVCDETRSPRQGGGA